MIETELMFVDFDTAVEYYKSAAIRLWDKCTMLDAKEVASLAGCSDKSVYAADYSNELVREGEKGAVAARWNVESVVRWMISSKRIRVQH